MRYLYLPPRPTHGVGGLKGHAPSAADPEKKRGEAPWGKSMDYSREPHENSEEFSGAGWG